MNNKIFGWNYPAGSNTKDAPWNDTGNKWLSDHCGICWDCKEEEDLNEDQFCEKCWVGAGEEE